MANRNDTGTNGRTENGMPNNNGFGGSSGAATTSGTSAGGTTPGSDTAGSYQGFHGGTEPSRSQGRFYGSAMQRIGELRGMRSSGREDEGAQRYGASGEYLGGNFGGGASSGYRGASGSYGGRESMDRGGGMMSGRDFDRDRSTEDWRTWEGRRALEARGGAVVRDPQQTSRGNTGGGDYTRSYLDEIGNATERLGYMGQRGDQEVRSRWLKEPLYAHDVMTRGPRTVMPSTNLRDAAQVMRDEDTGIVPVCDDSGKLLGVLTDRDMVVRAFALDKVPGQMRVSEIMSDDVACVTADESVHDILELMGQKQIRRVPVVDRDDRLIGIISMGDIARKADTDEDVQDALHRVSARRSFWSKMFR